MKHLFLALAGLFLIIIIQPAAAQNAEEILSKATAVYNRSNGIMASFSLHILSGTEQVSESLEGVIQMRGNKFALATPDVMTWYDGATQWTCVVHTGEVSVTTPEGDELQLTNPAILLASYQKDYTAAYKGDATAANGKAAYVIELTPKKKNNITGIELQIEKYTSLPVRIRAKLKNKLINTVQIHQIKTNVNQPDEAFVFPKNKYPQAEIIDLR